MKRILIVVMIVILAMEAFGCACDRSTPEEGTASAEVMAQQLEDPLPEMAATPSAEPLPSVEVRPSEAVTATPGPSSEVAYSGDKLKVEYYDIVDETYKTDEYEIDADSADLGTGIEAINKIASEQYLSGNAITLNSASFSDGNVFLDFSSDIYNINLGSQGEVSLLDSIADVYLNNLEGARAVFITVDGGSYSSGHIEVPKGEAYKTK